jgi:hypothetical protein
MYASGSLPPNDHPAFSVSILVSYSMSWIPDLGESQAGTILCKRSCAFMCLDLCNDPSFSGDLAGLLSVATHPV